MIPPVPLHTKLHADKGESPKVLFTVGMSSPGTPSARTDRIHCPPARPYSTFPSPSTQYPHTVSFSTEMGLYVKSPSGDGETRYRICGQAPLLLQSIAV